MSASAMIEAYLAGSGQLRQAVAGMSDEQARKRPVAGKWSTLEVVCHIADFEPIYADRMKRVIAEDGPKLPSGDPDVFARSLAYQDRSLSEELELIGVVRKQMARILEHLPPEAWKRVGIHSTDGELSLETLLKRITIHIPHHIQFIEEKRKALSV